KNPHRSIQSVLQENSFLARGLLYPLLQKRAGLSLLLRHWAGSGGLCSVQGQWIGGDYCAISWNGGWRLRALRGENATRHRDVRRSDEAGWLSWRAFATAAR